MRFIYMCTAIARAVEVARLTQRKINLHNQQEILNEARIAAANNAVLIGDLQIEIKKLELEELKRKASPPAFTPKDYE